MVPGIVRQNQMFVVQVGPGSGRPGRVVVVSFRVGGGQCELRMGQQRMHVGGLHSGQAFSKKQNTAQLTSWAGRVGENGGGNTCGGGNQLVQGSRKRSTVLNTVLNTVLKHSVETQCHDLRPKITVGDRTHVTGGGVHQPFAASLHTVDVDRHTTPPQRLLHVVDADRRETGTFVGSTFL